ncbi:hypothetical protein U1Q18_026593 [Sarracenia purpurea var. burkii]
MERQNQNQNKNHGRTTAKHKRKRNKRNSAASISSSLPLHDNSHTIFALIVAALRAPSDSPPPKKKKNKNGSHHQLILQLLNQLHLSLLSQIPNPNSFFPPNPNLIIVSPQLTLPVPILSLLPILLTSRCSEIVCKCAEFVGAASLFSLEMNEQITNDDEIVRGLNFALTSSKRRKSVIAACNAALDMSTTSTGRRRLLECSTLNFLIFRFLQVSKSSNALTILLSKEKGSEATLRIGFDEDDLPVLLLDAAITIINTCKIEQLEKIRKKLLLTLLAYLKRLWEKVRSQMLLGTNTIPEYTQVKHFSLTNIRTSNLAESIFRLSIIADQVTTPFHADVIKRSIFRCDGSSFEHFILNHWEVSPFLIRTPSKDLNWQNDIFSSFRKSLDFNDAVPSFLYRILKDLISCQPITSDELDILSFLKDVRSNLGCPMIYQQDIRVLKTQNLRREVHFFQDRLGSCCFQDPQFIYIDDILRCKEAYEEGYTVALRGMEFRFGSIAAIADGLAYLFGQPSAGVNMYLTPPNSQGLPRHRDDHCVLICQLYGVKKWTIFPQSSLQLPRLYEPVGSLCETERLTADGSNHFLLREGDILYIPRGFFHEACTVVDNDGPSKTAGFSLHLTLAIEVESPFEWEGFAHVALHNWYQNQKQSNYTPCDLLGGSLNTISVNLMHVAIKLIGDADPTFRKACLIGAISILSDDEGWLDPNQRTNFSNMIKSINANSRFSDALRSVTLSLGENEDPWQQIRWMHHLDEETDVEVQKTRIPSVEDSEHLIFICAQHKEEAEAAFMQVKSRFCSEVVFEDVEKRYNELLEKYRKEDGMLSSFMARLPRRKTRGQEELLHLEAQNIAVAMRHQNTTGEDFIVCC